MKYFVSSLEGELLDTAVIRALPDHAWLDQFPMPSSNWLDGGPLLDLFKLMIVPIHSISGATHRFSRWEASMYLAPSPPSNGIYCFGPTPLIAAMRCIVANLSGEEIDL